MQFVKLPIDEDFKQALGRVGVLLGGQSSEREISLQSGAAVVSALVEAGVEHIAIDVGANAIADIQLAKLDRAFVMLHGVGGEDGRMQAVLEYLGIPFTGSGVQSSALAMDKLRTKQLWRGVGLTTPDFYLLNASSDWKKILTDLGGEVMVKPANEGSSIGMARATTIDELAAAFALAEKYDGSVIAERLIVGSEYTVAILGNEALPPIKLETDHKFYDYHENISRTTRVTFARAG